MGYRFERVVKGKYYYLHSFQVHKKNLYYFSIKSLDSIDIPEGYDVVVSPRNGIPLLKKRVKIDENINYI